MALVHNKLPSKLEDGYIDMIAQQKGQYLSDATGYAGFQSTELVTPRYHVLCERMAPEIIEDEIVTGNWTAEMSAHLVTHYKDEARDQRSNRAGELFDIILAPLSLEILNNLLLDAHVYGGAQGQDGNSITPTEIMRGVEEHLFIETVRWTVYARPTG